MSLKLKLYTPHGVLVNGLECSKLEVPTSRGEITVLPEHTHLLTELGVGVLTAYAKQEKRHFSVTSGVLKIMNQEVSVLSTTAETPEMIDIDRAERAKQKAEEVLKGEQEALSDEKIIKFRRKRERAEMRKQLGYLRGK